MDALSVAALVVALAVGVWQWRVVGELKAIRRHLERMDGGDDRA